MDRNTMTPSSASTPAHARSRLVPSAGHASLQAPERIAEIPAMLRSRRRWIIVLAVATTLCGLMAYRSYEGVVQTIGRDTVPSIVAAEKIRTTLAAAHTQALDVFLATTPQDRSRASADFHNSTEQANRSLVDASQNITYGDQERLPILATMNGLADYLQTLGAAFAQPPEQAGTALAHADDLMRHTLLPATLALDDANFAHMDTAFRDGQQRAKAWLAALIGVSVVLVAALVRTQGLLTTVFRRRINAPMAAGTALLVACIAAFAVMALGTLSDIRAAKQDAFDSIHALTKARAVADVANAAESGYLIDQGHPDAQASQGLVFAQASDQLLKASLLDVDFHRLPLDARTARTLKGQGFLADELANITFEGEEDAARATAAAWIDYLHIDARIRALEGASRHAEAVGLCNGLQPGQSDWAFDRFDKALERTLKINQDQFDAAIGRGFAHVAWLALLLVPIFLAPALGAAIGIRQRLAEFRQ
jgi:hypothetical protein